MPSLLAGLILIGLGCAPIYLLILLVLMAILHEALEKKTKKPENC